MDFLICNRQESVFPQAAKKISQGKPTEKWVIFIRTGKPCRSSSIQGAPAGKGSPHDFAWIMLHCNRNSLNLSKASQFGSTLAGGSPFEGLCIGSSVRAWTRGVSFFGSGVPFWVPRRHVVVFSAQMRKIFPFGVLREVLSVHIVLSKLSLICKSPGRALQTSGERGLTPLKPAPNRNILHIRAHFPTR